jgi:hypothetical protein
VHGGLLPAVRSRPTAIAAGALLGYSAISFLYLGLRPLFSGQSTYIGYSTDPQIVIWSFAWWPHAILQGVNPLVTRSIWAPSGLDLAWVTATPGLALMFAPVTLLFGATTAFNLSAVLMPALAAWTAYLLCRRLTRQTWPSLVGGYLFGFSSYILDQTGHPHLTAAFLLPLVALVVLRQLDGELSRVAFVVRLAPLLALELLFSTEILFTLTLALASSLAIGFVCVPSRRPALRGTIVPIACAYLLAALVTAPFVYYLVTDFHAGAFHPPDKWGNDLLNFVVPTKILLAGDGPVESVSSRFLGNDFERDAYLGVPGLVVVALYAWERRRNGGARFLVVAFLAAAIASMGSTLRVDGRSVMPLPWRLVVHAPLFDNALAPRLSLYASLAAAVMVALWTAARRHSLARLAVPALAMAALLPNVHASEWFTSYTLPRFFTHGQYRRCLPPGGNILPLPVGADAFSDLWQVQGDFRFTMSGGYVSTEPPAAFQTPAGIRNIAVGGPVPPTDSASLRTYIRAKHVSTVVLDAATGQPWEGALRRLARPYAVGGVLVYRFGRGGRTEPCRTGS